MQNIVFAGMFLVCSGVLLEMVVENLLECKKGWWNQVILLVGCTIQSNMVIFFRDWINLIPTFLCFLLCVLFACRGSLLKKLTIGLMIMSAVFACNVVLDNFFPHNFNRYLRWLFRILFSAVLYVATRRRRAQRDYELSSALWRLMLLLTFTPIGVVMTVALLNRESYFQDPMGNLQALILMILSEVSLVGLLWTVTVLLHQQKLEQESMMAQMNQKYYEALEQQNFEVRRLKHDMANHLQALSALPEREKESYIQELLAGPAFDHSLKYCKEPVVNAVLGVKESLMRQKEIVFHSKVDIPEPLPLGKADICAVFGNALDNAIEACDKLAEKDREIFLESQMRKGLFVLEVKNPVRELPKREGDRFLSKKKDKKLHGFGLQSIREIVLRYGGGMEIQTEEGIFSLLLYLPLERQEEHKGEE